MTNTGWNCPQCGGAHGPHVDTCPVGVGKPPSDLSPPGSTNQHDALWRWCRRQDMQDPFARLFPTRVFSEEGE